jgi:Ca2+:H+ antiporter
MSIKPSLNWLLVLIPVTLVLRFVPSLHNETAIFVCSALSIIPLAGWMGRATESLAEEMGEGWGGFLNAAFGNAAELIIALLALSKGLVGVVKASITGSIVGNLLLVLGASAFAGGLKYREQRFNKTAVRTSSTSLMLAAIGLLIPAVFHHTSDVGAQWNPLAGQKLSLAIAVVLFLTYAAGLLFTLKTHKQLFSSGAHETPEHEASLGWSRKKSVIVLLVATVFVAIMSEFLVSSVETAREKFGFTEMFVGVIVVAIIGNAAEHSTAVLMAMKNKMDLAINIAVGSSLQIALFVAPVLVFVSYFFGHPMNLEFSLPEVVAVIVTVLVASQISGDGESNWLEGVQLLSLYLILGILFYYLPEEVHH